MSADLRCYTVAEVRAKLKLSLSTFHRLRRLGQLPFLDELRPRLGKVPRYRAEPVDRYLANQWGRPRLLSRRA